MDGEDAGNLCRVDGDCTGSTCAAGVLTRNRALYIDDQSCDHNACADTLDNVGTGYGIYIDTFSDATDYGIYSIPQIKTESIIKTNADVAWDLGAATDSSTITPDSYITVTIGTDTYRLDAEKVVP